MFYEATGTLLLIAIVISLYRFVRGPTAPDRMIALDSITTIVLVLIVLLAFIFGNFMIVDIAILYAILNFIGTLAISKYFLKERMWKE